MFSDTAFIHVIFTHKLVRRTICLKTYHKIFCHGRRKILFCYLDSTRITLAPRVHISHGGEGKRRCVEFFLVDLDLACQSPYIPIFRGSYCNKARCARARSDLASPPSLTATKTTTSCSVNQITEAKRAEEKNPIFFGENFSDVSKKWEIVDSHTSRFVRLCRDPRNTDCTEEKNFILWIRIACQNSACLAIWSSLSINIFLRIRSLIHIYLGIHPVIILPNFNKRHIERNLRSAVHQKNRRN